MEPTSKVLLKPQGKGVPVMGLVGFFARAYWIYILFKQFAIWTPALPTPSGQSKPFFWRTFFEKLLLVSTRITLGSTVTIWNPQAQLVFNMKGKKGPIQKNQQSTIHQRSDPHRLHPMQPHLKKLFGTEIIHQRKGTSSDLKHKAQMDQKTFFLESLGRFTVQHVCFCRKRKGEVWRWLKKKYDVYQIVSVYFQPCVGR